VSDGQAATGGDNATLNQGILNANNGLSTVRIKDGAAG
jgi:hypothetical protein